MNSYFWMAKFASMSILISNDMDQLCQKMPRPTSKFSLKAAYATLNKFALVMWWNALRSDEMTRVMRGGQHRRT